MSQANRVKLAHLVRFGNGQDWKEVAAPDGEFPVYGSGGEFGRASNFLHDGEAILFGRKGTVDRPIYVDEKFWTVDTMYYAVPNKDKCLGKYLFYWATTIPFETITTNTALPSVTSMDLSQLYVPLPPLESQQRIADYLDRETAEIDAAVADLDKYVELLETRRQLHIDQTFRALLEKWPLAPLGLFFSILNGDRGVNYPKAEEITQAGIPFINAGDVTERRVSLSQAKFVSEEKYESMGGAKLRQGDILFCLRGSLGKHGLVDFDGGSVASSLCILRPKNANTYRSRFLNLYLDSKFIESEVRFSENGSAQPNLSADSLSRFKVPAVSTEQQENVSTSLEEMHKEIDSLIIESTRLRDLLLKRRSVLITEVVTGRKQV